MKKPLIVVYISLLFFGVCLLPINTGQTLDKPFDVLIVDNEGDGDYRSLSAAIQHAEPGDIIQVYAGTYNETLDITINDLTIEGISHELGSGTDNDYPTINGQQNGSVLILNAQGCQITGLIITNSGNEIFDAGILIYHDNNIIKGNGIGGNKYGILINNCSEITIKANYIAGNQMDGIFLGYTWDNIIKENIIKENGYQGLFLIEVTDTLIQQNTIYLNDRDGIQLRSLCTENTIKDNEIYSNGIDGIKIWQDDVSANIIKNNQINNNKWNGIHLMNGYDNTCCENSITLNLNNGIHLGSAYENYIIRNSLSENKNHGIECLFHDCENNKFYYNNINDGVIDHGTNQWDDGIGTGGNHWTYYQGEDDNDDGIGDTPQPIEGNGNIDTHPFIEPFAPPAKPNIPSGQLVGAIDTLYTYSTTTTDSKYNQIQYGWDWDGDFNVDDWSPFYASQQPCDMTHQWDENGTYSVRVKAMDNYGFQSDWSDPLQVSMPKTPYHGFFGLLYQIKTWLCDHLFPFLQPILAPFW